MGKGQNNVLCDTVKIWQVSYSIVLFIEPEQIYYYCVLFWGPCKNITDQEPGGAGVSCRTIFRVCEERLIFRGNIHL